MFLTHLRLDHMGDLSSLYALGIVLGRFTPLHVWGPSADEERLGTAAAFGEGLCRSSWRGILRAASAWSTWGRAIRPSFMNLITRRRARRFTTKWGRYYGLPGVAHLDGPNSYRLDWNGLSIVYLGDGKAQPMYCRERAECRYSDSRGICPHASLCQQDLFAPASSRQHFTRRPLSTPLRPNKIFSLTRPHLPVLYHLMLSEDLLVRPSWTICTPPPMMVPWLLPRI
ncbi:MAG: hypothetical protein R2911_39885 [Caldilineaceae bacterium]